MTLFTRRASFLAAAGLVAVTAPALTAPAAHAQPDNDDDVVGPRAIETPGLAAPVRRDNTLIGYLFLTIRTTLTESVDVWATRERNHFLRDAYVRACFRNRLIDPARPNEVVQPLADTAFRAAAVEALGARAVQSATVIRAQALGARLPPL